MPVVHVVVPVYNERNTLEPCLRRLLDVAWPDGWSAALRLVDDASEPDAARAAAELVERLAADGVAIALTRHDVNRGKGAALQTGFDTILATEPGEDDLVTVQDADLEYDPADLVRLMEPIVAGETRAVIGSRWGAQYDNRTLKRKIHAWGNRMLTRLSNLMTGYRVGDMECCYKMLTVGLLRRLRPMLTEPRFGVEPQLVAGLARLRERLVEVPVNYDPRGPSAGKKIGWRDGLSALRVIARERWRAVPAASADGETSSPDAVSASGTEPRG